MSRQVAADLAEYERIADEMEAELQYSQTINWSNVILEQSIEEMKEELQCLEEEDYPTDEEALEWKTRYDSQVSLNRDLEQQRDSLQRQYDLVRRQFREAYKIETLYPEYDRYTELELARIFKQLERQKQQLSSQINSLQCQIDSESKEFYHYDELRRTYRADIGITERDLRHLQNVKKLVDKRPSPPASPMSNDWKKCTSTDGGRCADECRRGHERRATAVHHLPKMKPPHSVSECDAADDERTDGDAVYPRRHRSLTPGRPRDDGEDHLHQDHQHRSDAEDHRRASLKPSTRCRRRCASRC